MTTLSVFGAGSWELPWPMFWPAMGIRSASGAVGKNKLNSSTQKE